MGRHAVEMKDFSQEGALHAAMSAPAHGEPAAAPADVLRRSDAHIKSDVLEKKLTAGDAQDVMTWMNGYSDELLHKLHEINPRLARGCLLFLSESDDKVRQQWNTWLNPTFKTLLINVARTEFGADSYRAPSMTPFGG